MLKRTFLLVSLLFFVFCASSFAARIPSQDSGIEYFYIFGTEGNPFFGAYTGEITFYVDVPSGTSQDVIIKIIDPDTGGKLDDGYKDWNTETEFSVYGQALLDSKSFAAGEYDKQTYQFGPYPANKGTLIDGKYRFKVVVKPLKGDDANLFALDVSPDSSEVFTYALPFRLTPIEGKEMKFYPTVPANTSYITMRTYDIDPDGGTGYIYVGNKRSKVVDSGSGVWSETNISVANAEPVSLKYSLIKKTQKHGNAVISALDDKGNLVPIYFSPVKLKYVATQKETPATLAPKKRPIAETKKAKPAVAKSTKKATPATLTKVSPKCDTFIFDATESYDPNKRPLAFRWDFGDGATSEQAVVTHTYKKPGVYTVNLTVTNNTDLECNKDAKTQTIKVSFPPQPVMNSPETGCVGKEVILDATGTTDAEGDNISYLWDFGDGTTSKEIKNTHVYKESGIYKVTLTAKDDSGTSCDTSVVSRNIQINSSPIVKINENIVLCETNPDKALEVVFDGSGCSDPDGDKLTYSWDFGDGQKAQGQKVTHVYERGGSYTARLSLIDDSKSSCNSASATIKVNLNRAPKAVAGENQNICATDELVLDGSKSYDKDKDELKYIWDLGDGNKKEGARITHRYNKGGKYNVALTVDDGKGSNCSKSTSQVMIMANTGPFASLEAPKSACVGEQVSFDATGSHDLDGDNLTYTWNFGDGKELKVGPLVTHRFDKGGKYKVTVTVDDGKKSPCSTAISQTEIKINTPPVAISGPNLVCCAGDMAKFDGSRSTDADGDELVYNWDFGDGGFAKGAKVTHEYKKAGTYTVILTVDDNSGSKCETSTTKFIAEVSSSPVSVIKVKPKQ